MGNTAHREMISPSAINTPMMGFCVLSGVFNTMERGRLRIGNVYTNICIFMLFGLSTGFANALNDPDKGAKFGVAGSCVFLGARPLKVLYTNRLVPAYIHNSIGCFYAAYHSLCWYRGVTEFEDAGEDEDGCF